MTQVEAFRPELVLLDEDLAEEQLSELITSLHRLDFHPAVLVLVGTQTERAALVVGADAFVLKSAPPKDLLVTIRRIRLGNSCG